MGEVVWAGEVDVEGETAALLGEGQALGDVLAQLATRSAHLDKELRKQISSHHEKLLTQAMSIESLEEILDSLNHHIATLTSVAQRTSGKSKELFAKTQLRTQQLERLHKTCNILRTLIRVFNLCAKLQGKGEGWTEGGREMVQRSQMVAELEELTTETDLKGINCVEKDLLLIPRLRKELLDHARDSLRSALKTGNQGVGANAVGALGNLGELEREVERLADEATSTITARFRALGYGEKKTEEERKGPGGVKTGVGPSSVSVRAHIWEDVHAIAALLITTHSHILTLHTVLAKKHHVSVAEAPGILGDGDLVVTFWSRVAEIMGKELGDKVGLVRQTLESEYPKLLRPMVDVINRVAGHPDPAPLPHRIKVGEELRWRLAGLETAYLSKSLGNLFETVNMAFGEEAAPSDDDINRMTQLFLNLLQVTSFDHSLSSSVAKNIVKTIKLFGVKSENLINTNEGEATQVIGPPNAVQKRNMEAMNALYRFAKSIPTQVEKVRSSVGAGVVGEVEAAAADVLSLIRAGLQPLLQSFTDSISAIIETMHQEDFSQESGSDSGCSLYMRELEEFVGRVWSGHLSVLGCGEVVREEVVAVGRRAVRIFLIHASLVRPLGQAGRCRLAADFAQVQYALSPLCAHLATDLGPDYLTLRAARPLLFLSPQDIADADVIGKEVDYWLAVHLLIQASEAELSSPQETAAWSITRYAEWLEGHGGSGERLEFLRGTLDAYARKVASEGRSEYTPTYPIILAVLQRGANANRHH